MPIYMVILTEVYRRHNLLAQPSQIVIHADLHMADRTRRQRARLQTHISRYRANQWQKRNQSRVFLPPDQVAQSIGPAAYQEQGRQFEYQRNNECERSLRERALEWSARPVFLNLVRDALARRFIFGSYVAEDALEVVRVQERDPSK